MKNMMLSAALLATLSTTQALADNPYIIVWGTHANIGANADKADFVVYNMLDQRITLSDDGGWLHSDILGTIQPYSSQVDGSMSVSNDTSGTMTVAGSDGVAWFKIQASKSGSTNIWTITNMASWWDNAIAGGNYPSIAKIRAADFVVSLFACMHIDSGDGITGVGGPTQIVLLLSDAQHSDFSQSPVSGKFCANAKDDRDTGEFSYNKR